MMLVPESFHTDEAQMRSREANLAFQVAGQGFSGGGRGETSGSMSQQVSQHPPFFLAELCERFC